MQYNPSLPIYLQVEADIIKDMLNGKLSSGERLPSGRDLAVQKEEWGLSSPRMKED